LGLLDHSSRPYLQKYWTQDYHLPSSKNKQIYRYMYIFRNCYIDIHVHVYTKKIPCKHKSFDETHILLYFL
jgi:hypothetical protein